MLSSTWYSLSIIIIPSSSYCLFCLSLPFRSPLYDIIRLVSIYYLVYLVEICRAADAGWPGSVRPDTDAWENTAAAIYSLYCNIFCLVIYRGEWIGERSYIAAAKNIKYSPSILGGMLCVVFSSHSFWTSSSLDVPAGVTQEEGHTGFLIHLLSAVHALIFLARRIQPFLSLVDREVEFCVLTI